MSEIAHWFSFLGGVTAIPIFATAGVVLHYRLRQGSTMVLAAGLVLTAIGEFVQLFSPFENISYEESQNFITAHGTFPAIWYLGSVIVSIGFLVACAGFLWLSFTAKLVKK